GVQFSPYGKYRENQHHIDYKIQNALKKNPHLTFSTYTNQSQSYKLAGISVVHQFINFIVAQKKSYVSAHTCPFRQPIG
ncbi:MAG: hypothetical protein E6164_08325, partial [Dialister sp.]|nr:hypothetical protein [Dialister sp.]